MHELGRYLQREMEHRDWKASDLISRSGLSKQTVYNLLNDTRDRMDQTPQRKTIIGLSKALGVSEQALLIASARAIGVPSKDLPEQVDLSSLTDTELLSEIDRRFQELRQERASDVHPPTKRAGVRPAERESDDDGAAGTVDPKTGKVRKFPTREWLARHDRPAVNAIPVPEKYAARNTGKESEGDRRRRLHDEGLPEDYE